MSAPAAEQVPRHVGRALAPHRPVAVVQLLVLEEHRRHHRQVRHRLAGPDRRDGLLREHHGLDGEDVDPALGERLRLLLEGLEVLVVGGHVVAERPYSSGQAAGRADGARHVAAGRADRPGQPRALLVQLARCRSPIWYSFSLSRVPPKVLVSTRSRARVEVALVDAAHHVGVRVVPQLRAGAVQEARGEERGAVAAVEDEALAGARRAPRSPSRAAAPPSGGHRHAEQLLGAHHRDASSPCA